MGEPWVRLTRIWDTYDASLDAVGGYERGLDIDETLLEEVCGFGGALALAFWARPSVVPDVTRHDL